MISTPGTWDSRVGSSPRPAVGRAPVRTVGFQPNSGRYFTSFMARSTDTWLVGGKLRVTTRTCRMCLAHALMRDRAVESADQLTGDRVHVELRLHPSPAGPG